MSQRKAAEAEAKLIQWIEERDLLNDFGEYQKGLQVYRKALIDEGVLRRSQLSANGNPRLRDLLSAAETRWYGQQVETLESHRNSRESAEKRAKLNSAEVTRLQDKLARAEAMLKAAEAEITRLKRELGSEQAVKTEVLARYGAASWD